MTAELPVKVKKRGEKVKHLSSFLTFPQSRAGPAPVPLTGPVTGALWGCGLRPVPSAGPGATRSLGAAPHGGGGQ